MCCRELIIADQLADLGELAIARAVLDLTTVQSSYYCPDCGSPNVRVKTHPGGRFSSNKGWVGYYCPKCGSGGSSSIDKLSRFTTQPKKPSPKMRPEVIIDIKPEWYDKSKHTFRIDMDDANVPGVAKKVKLRNPKSGNVVDFNFVKPDNYEDPTGYWYESSDRKYKLVLINA